MTSDVSARDVVCDVGPTKGEEVEEGGHPLYITFHFRLKSHHFCLTF